MQDSRGWYQINVRDPFDVRWWAAELGVSGVEVLEACRNVGPIVADVRAFLARAAHRKSESVPH